MPVLPPDPSSRWRCTSCGNLTRFDVRRTRQTAEYWHLDLAGEVSVAETEVLAETLEQVRCRWCGAIDAVELVPRPAGSEDPAPR